MTSVHDTNSLISIHDDGILSSYENCTTTKAYTTDDEYSKSDEDESSYTKKDDESSCLSLSTSSFGSRKS